MICQNHHIADRPSIQNGSKVSEITSFALKTHSSSFAIVTNLRLNYYWFQKKQRRRQRQNELINLIHLSILLSPRSWIWWGFFLLRHCISPSDKNTFIILLKYYLFYKIINLRVAKYTDECPSAEKTNKTENFPQIVSIGFSLAPSHFRLKSYSSLFFSQPNQIVSR